MLSQEQELGNNAPTSEMTIHRLSNEDTLAQVFEHSDNEPVVIFKHSVTCAISAMARRRMLHLYEDDDPPVYEVVVQSSRPLSQRIEQSLGIRHESPQVIVLHKQQPVYNTSHGMITVDNIRTAITQVSEAE